jgi:hypothetical protein
MYGVIKRKGRWLKLIGEVKKMEERGKRYSRKKGEREEKFI